MNIDKFFMAVFCTVVSFGVARADSVDITVREAPHVVTTVSSKSENAWAKCRYCGSKIRYVRTYKRDVYNKEWIETTKEVPESCRICARKDREQEKLDRREAQLDRDIKYQKTRQSISNKERELRRLRKATR